MRGEEFALQATVFNYLSSSLQVNFADYACQIDRVYQVVSISVLQFHFIIYYFCICCFYQIMLWSN